MNENLLDLLTGEIAHGVADLLFGEQIIPHPKRTGAVFTWWIGEEFLHGRRIHGARLNSEEADKQSEQWRNQGRRSGTAVRNFHVVTFRVAAARDIDSNQNETRLISGKNFKLKPLEFG